MRSGLCCKILFNVLLFIFNVHFFQSQCSLFPVLLKVPLMCNIRLWRGWFSFNRRLRRNTAVVPVLPSPKTWICHNLEIKTQDGGWFHPSKGSYKRTSSPPKNHSPMSPAAPWRCRRVQSRHLDPFLLRDVVIPDTSGVGIDTGKQLSVNSKGFFPWTLCLLYVVALSAPK